MSDRSWFFASQGQQQGPYPQAQLREFIANGTVTAETLVWTEGMTGWQKAGEIPGLLSCDPGPPAIPGPGAFALTGGSLSSDFGIWGTARARFACVDRQFARDSGAVDGDQLLSLVGRAFAAWIRWICRNFAGTRRQITFNSSGWQMPWRTLVFSVGMVFIIPIPWALTWYVRWNVSQFALVERTAYANA
jgi:GYF domain 2